MPKTHQSTLFVVQNSRDCPPGLLGEYLTNQGVAAVVWPAYSGAPLPERAGTADGLVILGGPQAAADRSVPWFPNTRALIRDFHRSHRPVLGICLGHQLIAETLDGRTGPNPAGHTIGTRPMYCVPENTWVPSTEQVMHWNSDVVLELPQGSRVLARTADGAIQAAHYGNHSWGVQGHPEAGLEVITRWVADEQDALRLGHAGIDVHQVGAQCAHVAENLTNYAQTFGAAFIAYLDQNLPEGTPPGR